MGTYRIHSADERYGDDAQRPCARGKYCNSRNQNHEPALGPRALCSADRDALVRALEQIPEMYLELFMILGEKGSGGGDGPRVSGGAKTPPIPVRPDVNALMVRIVEELTSWDARVRFVARLDLSGHEQQRRDSVAMSTACRTLAAHVDALLALESETMNRSVAENAVASLPDDTEGHVRPAGWAILRKELGGAEAAVEIFSLHAACRSKLGYTRRSVLLRSRCWDCDASGKLVREDGSAGLDDHVSCRACRVEYAGERLALLMAAEARIMKEIASGKKAS
jgi:hypothetical protein